METIEKMTNAEKAYILAGFAIAVFWSDLNKTFVVTMKIPLLGGLGFTYVLVGINLIRSRITADGHKIADSIMRTSIDDLEIKLLKKLEDDKVKNDYGKSGS